MESTKDIGVIVGRFQVNELHTGHIDLIDNLIKQHKRAVVFLGVSPVLVTRNNPLDFLTRKEMLLQRFPQITVLSIPDNPSDAEWSRELDRRIREACPVGSVVLYGSRDSFIKYYSGHFDTEELPAIEATSGTEVRNGISKEVKASPDFRAGVIFAAYNQYPKVYATVDVAIMDGNKVLLGRKPHQEKFRFIGGFSDPTDDSYEAAAIRETKEETGLDVADLQFLGSAKIDDWRYRSETDKIITSFFMAKYQHDQPTPQDDIAELKWFGIDDLNAGTVVAEHQVLIPFLKKHKQQ